MEVAWKITKKVLFFLLLPIYVPVSLFVNATYDWWVDFFKSNKLIFFALSIIYAPLSLLMLGTFEWWVKLSD